MPHFKIERCSSVSRPFHLRMLLAAFGFLVFSAGATFAQSALDGFNPNANGTIWAIVVQADGKILIGGEFTELTPDGGGGPVTRNRIARLNPDGTVDNGFNPNISNTVYAIAVQADGKVLVGGSFSGASSVGGQARNLIARLDALTGAVDTFNPNASGGIFPAVRSIVVQADGKILAGGSFATIGGQSCSNIARLDATTGAADAFSPNANNTVYAITVQADGRVLVGGFFNGASSIGGQARSGMARLDAATGAADSFNPNAAGQVYAIALQADGKILAAGDFSGIGGAPRNDIARLDTVTGLADSFDPNATGSIYAVSVQAGGQILAGGTFTNVGGQTRNNIARLNAATGLADGFNPNTGNVLALAVQSDGKILMGGSFTSLSPNGGTPVTRNRIARLETNGTLDQTVNLGIPSSAVYAIAVQPDGKFLIGGDFTVVLGVARNYIARLNTDGTLDTSFNPNANNTIFSLAVQADGRILAGGSFTTIGGQARNRIARLDAATGSADAFNPDSNGIPFSIAVQADGRILAGGGFTSIGGQPRNNIARLNGTTGLADGFNPNANNTVYSIAVQADGRILVGGSFQGTNSIGAASRQFMARLDPGTGLADGFNPNATGFLVASIAVQQDGKILVGGDFSDIGSQTRNRIARLDPGTGSADSFNPNANNSISSIAVQADGQVLVSGTFSVIGGQGRANIARLDAVTGLADSFNPSANLVVYSVAVQADGKILLGGSFANILGQNRKAFARLSNNTAALQDISVTRSTVTWTRGGASSQFTRVAFESSTDSVNYTALGNGTAAGSNWTLTGLNLPTGQNIYIRARGYSASGYFNGSGSITESVVRNAFLTNTPTVTGAVTYGNAIGAPNPRVVSNVLMSGAGSVPVSGSTGPGGNYSLSGFGSGSYTVTPAKTGGVNGGITSFDAGRVAQHVAGSTSLTGNQLIVADVSGNNMITSFDAAQIAQFVAGSGGMQTGSWKFVPVNRMYAPVTADITGEDYTALLMGEVSGNWTNTAARETDGHSVPFASAPDRGEITGRSLTATGQGVPHAVIKLTDPTGETRFVLSNGFGVYRFGGLQVGQTYTINVESRRYTFAPLTVSVTDQLVNMDMIAAK